MHVTCMLHVCCVYVTCMLQSVIEVNNHAINNAYSISTDLAVYNKFYERATRDTIDKLEPLVRKLARVRAPSTHGTPKAPSTHGIPKAPSTHAFSRSDEISQYCR